MEEMTVAERIVAVRGRAEAAIGLFDQIFDDRPGLGDDEAVIVDHRRLAERVNLPQLGRGEHRRLVPLDSA